MILIKSMQWWLDNGHFYGVSPEEVEAASQRPGGIIRGTDPDKDEEYFALEGRIPTIQDLKPARKPEDIQQ